MSSKYVKEFETSCQKTAEHFKSELGKLRGGRATTSLLETIQVNYYGSNVGLQSLGMIAAPEPRLLTVQVYDTGAVEAVEKAIQQSELGLNPSREGNLIRVIIPTLSEERRKDLIKTLHRMAEETKVIVRNSRRDCLDKIKKSKDTEGTSEDEIKRSQDEVQKVTDKYTKVVDEILAVKEKEMLAV